VLGRCGPPPSRSTTANEPAEARRGRPTANIRPRRAYLDARRSVRREASYGPPFLDAGVRKAEAPRAVTPAQTRCKKSRVRGFATSRSSFLHCLELEKKAKSPVLASESTIVVRWK
jgi:hypothetical protein